jgi:uncharacterized protein (TIGR01777 family)
VKILVTGASGLIGSALIPYLKKNGHLVTMLVRDRRIAVDAYWNPEEGIIQLPENDHFDAVIHLAGENIADGRWNDKKKQRIRFSRINGTILLTKKIAILEPKPKVMLSASGIGIYGNQGERILTESDPPGDGFLVDVSQKWESATYFAEQAHIRVVHLRIAPVLSRYGGILKRMLPFFKLGLGASLGSGKQYMSWIVIDDIIRVIDYLLHSEYCEGPVNICTPNPVTNRELTKKLGWVLHRPALLKIPQLVLKIIFGEIADQELVSSTRAIPAKLNHAGFEFRYPELEGALNYLFESNPYVSNRN